MEKGKYYYYNNVINKNEIISIESWRNVLDKEVHVLALY